MPISACLGRAGVMDTWPASEGEALHTQTFLGHPPGCAAALASLAVLEEERLVEAAAQDGAAALRFLRERLDGEPRVAEVRGVGLMIGIECDRPETAARACAAALSRGVILLPSGDDGRVLSITPPLCIGCDALTAALDVVAGCIR
jgi:4-aminobutyrate aminotransferase/(S)-3-amino-2-methylpropionate transaminase